MRRFRPCLYFFLGLGAAVAAPTHRLVQGFEHTAGGERISLPAGETVEVTPAEGKSAMVRHLLPDGSTTLLFIPMEYLEVLKAPPDTPATPSPPPTPPTAPTQAPDQKKSPQTRLATKDGRAVEGDILRLEKNHVVILDTQGEPHDLLLKNLDSPSQDLIDSWKFKNKNRSPKPDPRVTPGQKFSLEFPELGPSRSSETTKIQIRIPENYRPDKDSPLALYLGGGQGTDNCGTLKSFVDAEEWILVAFPYPKNAPVPLNAYEGGNCGELIKFQEPMLERLQALLPNTDSERRVVIGSSNGAHMIAIGACDGWKDFPEYFSAFVMHEGGGSVSKNFRNLRRKSVLALMGDQSTSLRFSQGVVAKLERARVKPDVFVAQGEGHGMGDASRLAIREWIAKLPKK